MHAAGAWLDRMKSRTLSLASILLLVAAALPLAQVQAHTCSSTVPVAPENPGDPDTGCNGSSCPCTSAPHDHKNTVPGNSCSKEDDRCTRPGCPPRVVAVDILHNAAVNVRVACAIVNEIIVIGGVAALP